MLIRELSRFLKGLKLQPILIKWQTDAKYMKFPFSIFHFPFSVFGLFVFLILPSVVSAQVAVSNCVYTKVGNPLDSLPVCGSGSTAANNLVRSAEDIKTAYDNCIQPQTSDPDKVYGGYTHNYPGMDVCLRNTLQTFGYSNEQLDAFEKVRTRLLVSSPINKSLPWEMLLRSCDQCVGYVATALALAHDTPSVLTGGSLNCAGSINGFPSGFGVGSYFYTRIGSGYAGTDGKEFLIQAGDVAVAGSGCNPFAKLPYGDYGHILIVSEVTYGGGSFTAFESNAGHDCKVTGGRSINRTQYTFYHLQ
jgi:hypothetical protein